MEELLGFLLVTLLHKFGPIANRRGHVSAVDIVVRLGLYPVLFDIVYQELDVW